MFFSSKNFFRSLDSANELIVYRHDFFIYFIVQPHFKKNNSRIRSVLTSNNRIILPLQSLYTLLFGCCMYMLSKE